MAELEEYFLYVVYQNTRDVAVPHNGTEIISRPLEIKRLSVQKRIREGEKYIRCNIDFEPNCNNQIGYVVCVTVVSSGLLTSLPSEIYSSDEEAQEKQKEINELNYKQFIKVKDYPAQQFVSTYVTPAVIVLK